MSAEQGRRERKKAATRAAISEAALELFLSRGFDAVSIRDVADRADVAVATVFAHFSGGKEALVFDEEEAVARSLLDAVENRPPSDDALTALENWFLAGRLGDDERRADQQFIEFRRLVDTTPALQRAWRDTWRSQAEPLADTMTRTTGMPLRLARILATLVIEGYLLAAGDPDPRATLRQVFQLLRTGAVTPAPDHEVSQGR